MKLNLKRPLVFFDLETTGTNPSKDRIIEYAFIKLMPDESQVSISGRVNPEMPIPKESTEVHGITDMDVKDEPSFKEVAMEILRFIEDCDLAGYNLLRFDVPVLNEEFSRSEINFDPTRHRIVDAQHIFYLMEPRTLKAAYKYFCGKSLDNAHSALADTQATLEVLKAQVERYEGVTIEMDGEEKAPIVNDIDALHGLTASKFVDLAGRFAYNDKGEEVFNFGKFKGQTVESVLAKEPGYYDWMMKGDFPMDTKRALTRIRMRALTGK